MEKYMLQIYMIDLKKKKKQFAFRASYMAR